MPGMEAEPSKTGGLRGAGDALDAPGAHRPVWLTALQATTYLGFPSRRALYMAVRRGQVPVHRLGRRLRFAARDLDAALTGQAPLRDPR